MSGLFFVFEGGDGSGQDTQAELLKKGLEEIGYKVWLTREPTDGLIGQEIRKILRKEKSVGQQKIQELMVKDRAEHVREIEDKIAKGYIVISVRYFYSTLAYGVADGLDYDYLWGLNSDFPRPDQVFYLDLEPRIALERIEGRGKPIEHFEREEFLQKVRQNFLSFLSNFPEFHIVDALPSIEEVHEKIVEIASKHLN
ncbi:MAG: dTMP kinase [Patescibacteria group bacterium]|nr:dTMP kinase [Patescibacteria group bacterium]